MPQKKKIKQQNKFGLLLGSIPENYPQFSLVHPTQKV